MSLHPVLSQFATRIEVMVMVTGIGHTWYVFQTNSSPVALLYQGNNCKGRCYKLNWTYPLVIGYIAIEHGPFTVDLPIKDGGFP